MEILIAGETGTDVAEQEVADQTDGQTMLPPTAPPGGAPTTGVNGYTPSSQSSQLVPGHSQFEGADVDLSEAQLSGKVSVELPEDVSIDDRIRLCGEFRCTGVYFVTDKKTGGIKRRHLLQPLADTPLQVVPFDSTNPLDKGIVHMRPPQP